MSNYLLSHTGAQIDAGIDAALNIENTIAARIGSTGPAGVRNLIRNPRFAVNRRNVSGTVTLSANAYGHDGWKAGASGCTYTFATYQGRTTLTITAGSLVQTIDGSDLFAGSNTYTLSWGGTCQGKVGSGSYSTSGVTGSVTGGANINIEFCAGTLYNPQFEIGTASSDFNYLDNILEGERSQAYLPVVLSGFVGNGYIANTTTATASVPLHLIARSVPTGLTALPANLILAGSFGSMGVSGVAINANSSRSCIVLSLTISGGTAGLPFSLSSSVNMLFTGCEI